MPRGMGLPFYEPSELTLARQTTVAISGSATANEALGKTRQLIIRPGDPEQPPPGRIAKIRPCYLTPYFSCLGLIESEVGYRAASDALHRSQ